VDSRGKYKTLCQLWNPTCRWISWIMLTFVCGQSWKTVKNPIRKPCSRMVLRSNSLLNPDAMDIARGHYSMRWNPVCKPSSLVTSDVTSDDPYPWSLLTVPACDGSIFAILACNLCSLSQWCNQSRSLLTIMVICTRPCLVKVFKLYCTMLGIPCVTP